VVAGSAAHSWLTRRPGPVLPHVLRGFSRSGETLVGRLAADGRGELATLAFGSFVRSLAPGRQIPSTRPVPEAAGLLARLLPPVGPTALLVRTNPPQLPVPRNVAQVLDNVASGYDRTPAPHTLAMPEGAISVQELTHPDGTRAWVIEIPGTETWEFNAHNPMDGTTNLRLIGGVPDDMTDMVLEAMRLSRIGPDEPVMLAGHSQGGMAAMSVAAAVGGLYSVRAVVTAGTPDIPRGAPSGVQVRHYEHTGELVPQLDGIARQTSEQVTVVQRDLSVTGRPDARSIDDAHAMRLYVETAVQAEDELAGSPGMRAFDAAARDVLGPEGTTAVTRQFQVTRDPAVVAAQPPRLWPSS
jgi:pimeloyl-ACP methyl ester carboxylesterase